jgi:hypothetical protein
MDSILLDSPVFLLPIHTGYFAPVVLFSSSTVSAASDGGIKEFMGSPGHEQIVGHSVF